MAHFKSLVSGVSQVESDLTYFRKRASEERTAALHARNSAARTKHAEKAESYEARVRAIATRNQERLLPSL